MWAWLRHMMRVPPPPQDADGMLRMLRLSARVMKARNPEASAQLESSADAFQRAVQFTRKHGDQPTNDELTAILSSAQMDIQEQFSAQMELSKAILLATRGTEAAVGELRATFHNGMSALGERLTDIEAWRTEVDTTLANFRQSRDASQQRHDDAEISRDRIEGKVDTLAKDFADFRDEIRQLIAGARKPEEVDRLVGLIEKHEAAYQARLREADDAG